MNKDELRKLKDNMIESLENYQIPITKNMLLALDECKDQEKIDNFFDDYFKQKWLSKDDYNYDRVEEHDNGILECYIGNGMYGFEYEGKRFMILEEAEEYVEENEEKIEDNLVYIGDSVVEKSEVEE